MLSVPETLKGKTGKKKKGSSNYTGKKVVTKTQQKYKVRA